MKDKKVVIGFGIVVVLILIVAAYYFFSSSPKTSEQTSQVQSDVPEEEIVPTLVPKELGLTLTARADKKAVKFSIDNVDDITLVEYEITYLAKGDIQRGVIGSLEPVNGKLESKYIDLGSCSSGKCKYDEGVTSVKFLLKITKKDDKTYQTEESLPL